MVRQVIGNIGQMIGMIASLAVGIKMQVVTGTQAPSICIVSMLALEAEARHQKGM